MRVITAVTASVHREHSTFNVDIAKHMVTGVGDAEYGTSIIVTLGHEMITSQDVMVCVGRGVAAHVMPSYRADLAAIVDCVMSLECRNSGEVKARCLMEGAQVH